DLLIIANRPWMDRLEDLVELLARQAPAVGPRSAVGIVVVENEHRLGHAIGEILRRLLKCDQQRIRRRRDLNSFRRDAWAEGRRMLEHPRHYLFDALPPLLVIVREWKEFQAAR